MNEDEKDMGCMYEHDGDCQLCKITSNVFGLTLLAEGLFFSFRP